MTTHDTPTLDRGRLARLTERENARFADAHRRSGELFSRRARPAPRRRPDELDGEVGRASSGLRGPRRRRALLGRRRERVRGLLPRRHRRDGRALPCPDRGGRPSPGRARDHDDAPHGGRDRGRRGAAEAVRPPVLAVHDHRHGCEPVRAAARADAHGPAEGPRPRPLLSRVRGRVARDARRGRAWSIRATGTSGRRWIRRSPRRSWSSTTSRRWSGRWPPATSRPCSSSRPSRTSGSSSPTPGITTPCARSRAGPGRS